MKDSKAVYVTKNLKVYNRNVALYPSEIINQSCLKEYEFCRDFSCQFDNKTDVLCTCRKTRKRYYLSHDVYRAQERYPAWKSFTEIGVGSVKTLPKQRTKRIYLPETRDKGIGSSDLLLERQHKHCEYSYYEQKRTSSKCVGGILDTNMSVVNQKLSPIVQTKSGTTSPVPATVSAPTLDLDVNSPQKNKIKTQTQIIDPKICKRSKDKLMKQVTREIVPKNEVVGKIKITVNQQARIEKDYSSDSLVQHIHNLENPSFDKQSKTSLDPMENKLEREYRKMFATENNESVTKTSMEKPSSDLKRPSALRRRFESLRKGICKKEDSTKEAVVDKIGSRKSILSRKDVSIASDPPSLEAKSYSNTKIYSPYTSFTQPYKTYNPTVTIKKSPEKRQGPSGNWSTDIVDSECQSVRGMFKLWGKKFNFEEDNYKKTIQYTGKTPENVVEIIVPDKRGKEKKGSKRFFFFNKKSKENKQVFKSKKGVTAGRCEVEDGLTIKIDPKKYHGMIPEVITSDEFENYDNILRKSWLKRFLTNKVDSRRSVKIRWNNNMYSTSSSTVFELLDCVYKNTGIVMGSRSEISTCDSSNYYANNRQVKFMPNNIEAWMIPQTIINSPYKSVQNKNMEKNRNIEVTYLDRKWYIDKSHRGNKIELVLQSKNIIQAKKSKSSDYILIDIPKGYFTDSVESNQHQTSEEEVYKITDYESPNSKIFVNKKITDFHMGDHISKEEKEITVAIRNHELVESNTLHNLAKKLPLLRDVVIQGSQVYIPKHCDVIGVGIITQRDIRDIKKPILKIQDDLTDSESAHEVSPLKKCEFAESYLQDYYKNWTPLGIDFFSWCVSDTQLRSSENNSRTSLNNQGDGSKSCPNMFDDYQGSSVVSSCNTSSCSRCVSSEQEKKKETKKDTLFSKFFCKNADVINTEARSALSEGKRFLPKDSLEVFKRRRVYANGYNSKWNALCPKSSPAPSIHIGDKCKPQPECPRDCNKPKKHVLIPDCQPYEVLQDPCDKCFPGILSFKDSTCKKVKQKHISVMPDPVCAIPPKPLCSNLCAKECSPPCSKGKKQGRPCSGKTPPICSKCSPLQPCEIAKLLKNCSDCPSLPQKCPTCGTSILPEKCPNCRVPILPQKCPKCCTPVSPLKCAKCCLPIVPQNCPNCPSQALLQKCQKCCLPMLPQKCPKCSSIVLPQKCPKCGVPLLPQRCPQCSTPIVPQKCPKCSIPILPQKCSNCSSPTSHGTCPKCSTPVGPQKCSNCCSPILPEKCRKCGSLVLPPKCRECSLTTLPQTCPRCSTIILSQKCLHCSSASLPDKCPNCCIPILPQKCPQCFTVILPTKCQKCATIVMPVTCPKCRSTIPPQKCPKCSIQVFPQICPNCRESVPQKCQKSCSPIQQQKCPKCSTPALPQKCPKCCQLILPTKCAQCDMPILPTNCSKCNASIPPQKCPKCSTVIIPQNCPRCQSPAPRQKCPKSCSPICPQKCPCSFTLLTKKCPSKPACLSPKQSNNSIRSNRYCPPKTSSPQRCASPPKNNQSCGLKIQKTATKCNKTSNPPTPPPTIACPPTRSDSQQCLKNRNDSIIRINSRENIRINLKKETPSTEEIREGYNIKVQDEDGQTLYERIDYRKPQNNKQSFHMQNKICGDSYIHRVSTPSMVLNKVALNENTIDARKSATSLENLIEINLTLKLKQCDKTEVNFCNPVDIKKEKDYVEAGAYQTKDIFQVQDQAKEPTNTEKNDVNIKILIKNFIPNDEYKSKRENNNINEQFSNSISEKFHTVSTGYSEFLLNQPAFPVETSALGVTKSAESIEKTKASKQKLEENALIPIDSTTSAFIVADQTVVENTVNFMKNDVDLTIKSDCSDRKSKESFKNIHESNTEKSETAIFMTDEEKCFENPDQEKNEKCKLLNRRQKKKMLKKLFEEASTVDGTNKEKVKGVKEMLRTILTSDSSGTEDISESVTTFAKGVTLKPHFKSSASMTNFYNIDNTIVEENLRIDEVLYPTKENSSECSDADNDNDVPKRCMCRTFAAKLNMITPGVSPCCCRGCDKQDEEIHCNLIHNPKSLVDVQTQDSRNTHFKTYTTNVSTIVKLQSRESKEGYGYMDQSICQITSGSFQTRASTLERQSLTNSSNAVMYLSNSNYSIDARNYLDLSDVLQSDETKKAVLEIYAEKTVTDAGTHFIAKLPKFILSND